MKVIQVTSNLGSFLREYALKSQGGFVIEIPGGSSVKDLLQHLRIPEERVRMILANGKGIDGSAENGDRVAFFPPEVAFNSFVAFGFRKGSRRFQQGR